MEKGKIMYLGTTRNRITRNKLVRVDSEFRQGRVERSRQLIFDKGYSVSRKAVDRLLGDHSWAPTRVSCSYSKFP